MFSRIPPVICTHRIKSMPLSGGITVSFVRKIFSMGVILLPGFFAITGAFAQQPLLTITSPGSGTLLQEGQTYTITVSSDPSVQNIGIDAEYPVPYIQPTSNPRQFSLTLPMTIPPRTYQLTAVGSNSGGIVASDPIAIDIERPDDPVKLWAEPLLLSFKGVGAQRGIIVYGTFADGTGLIISESSKTLYLSDNTQVATVAATGLGSGLVTAVAPGQGSIIIQSGPSLYFPVSVTVDQPAPTGPAPTIASVVPAGGRPGVTQVTVTGSHFGATQGKGTLQLGIMSATTISSWTDSKIVATIPEGSLSGIAEVDQGGLYSNPISFTVVAPTITTVTPPAGVPGTQVTINGSNFGAAQGSSSANFNGGIASPTSWTDSSIVTSVPSDAMTGTVIVLVHGTPSNGFNFTVPPNIAALSPIAGAVGAAVTVRGTGFGPGRGTNTISFNGVIASPTAWSPTSIAVPVPSGATMGNVVVTINGVPSNVLPFTVLPSPNSSH
jgi:hypothetical protein